MPATGPSTPRTPDGKKRPKSIVNQTSSRTRRIRVAVIASVAVVAALALVITLAAVNAGHKKAAATRSGNRVVAEVASVPQAVLDQVGVGKSHPLSSVPSGKTLASSASNGKPVFVYVGAEYCPYCATERWGVVQALSRFGTFSNLDISASSPTDAYPNTATFTFHGSTYRSNYLQLQATETNSNVSDGQGYKTLDTETALQQQLERQYNPQGNIPFLVIDGQFGNLGASYDPAVLKGKTAEQIAESLQDPNSPVAQGVLGLANRITAAICKVTNGQPEKVCTTSAAKVSPSS